MLFRQSLRLLALLLLLVNLSHADWIKFCQNDMFYCSIYPVIMLIVLLVLVFLYMLSQTLMSPQLEAWVKLELRETIAAAILAIIVIALVSASDYGIGFLTGGKNMVQASADYIDTMNTGLSKSYKSMVAASHYLTSLVGFNYNYPALSFYYGSFTYSSALDPGASVFFSSISQASNGIANMMFTFTGLKILLEFLTSPAFLIPIVSLGLAFRSISFTRQLGTTLVALALGAAIVFPFSLLVMMEFNNTVLGQGYSPPVINDFSAMKLAKAWEIKALQWICAWGFDFFGFEISIRSFLSLSEIGWGLLIGAMCVVAFKVCFDIVTNVIYPIVAFIIQLFFGILLIEFTLSSNIAGPDILATLRPFYIGINELGVMVILDVLLVAIITIVGTKSVSTALGGDYYLVGLQRLV